MTINVFLPFLLFFCLSLNWERERVYNWVLGETVLMFTYLFDGFLRRVFSLLRVDRILYIYNALAWRHRFFFLSKILSAFFTRSLGIRSHVLSQWPHLQNWYSLPLFPLTEEGGYFRFGILANYLASIFFSPCQVIH